MPTARLEQALFIVREQQRPLRDLVVHKDLSGHTITSADLSPKVRKRIERLSHIIVPSIEIRGNGIAALAGIASLSQEQQPNIQLAETIPSPEAAASPAWLDELALGNVILDTSDIRRVPYLELMDRLAQVLDLQVGVLPSGELIFGQQGAWVEGYVPACTIELSVRAPQALIQEMKSNMPLDQSPTSE